MQSPRAWHGDVLVASLPIVSSGWQQAPSVDGKDKVHYNVPSEDGARFL